MLLINGEICPTRFAVGAADFIEPALNRTIYADWHHDVERELGRSLEEIEAPSRRLLMFDDRTWHRGAKAVAGGWRFFIRASRYYAPDGSVIARGNPRTNEIRRQVQVYLEDPNAGW
jgi:hypothetical protein